MAFTDQMQKKAVILGLILSAIFLYLAVKDVDYASFKEAFKEAKLVYIIPFLVLQIVFYGLKLLRWQQLINEEKNSGTSAYLNPMMTGFAANNILPFRAGELVRVFIAGKTLAIARARVLGSVVTERLFDLFAVGLIVGAALLCIVLFDESPVFGRTIMIAAAVAIAISLVLLLVLPILLSRYTGKMLSFLPTKFATKIGAQLEHFVDGFQVTDSRRTVVTVSLNSIAQWLALTMCILLSLVALGVEIPTGQFLSPSASAGKLFAFSGFTIVAAITMGIMVLGISIPSTAAFVGTIEYAFVLSLGFFGVDPTKALAAGVFYHVLSFLFVTITGGFCYLSYRLGQKQDSAD